MLEVEISPEGVATLALNRPEVLNALNTPLIEALLAAFERLKQDPAVRVLLFTGRGRGFCAGADLRDPMMGMGLPAAERGRRFLESADRGVHALPRALAGFGKPTVVAVNGGAVGGGSSLALAGQIVLAARSAYFQQPFTAQLGLVPDMGGSWQLARKLGPTRATALLMLGERLPAQQACDWGLIWQVVEDEALQDTAMALARRLAAGPPRALAALPALVAQALQNGLDAQLDAERDLQSQLVQTEDFMEAVRAFGEKRPPRFEGR